MTIPDLNTEMIYVKEHRHFARIDNAFIFVKTGLEFNCGTKYNVNNRFVE